MSLNSTSVASTDIGRFVAPTIQGDDGRTLYERTQNSPLEDRLLGQAVANTKSEIFRLAWTCPNWTIGPEGNGRRVWGQHEAEEASNDSLRAIFGQFSARQWTGDVNIPEDNNLRWQGIVAWNNS
jgi:hypothetical protein